MLIDYKKKTYHRNILEKLLKNNSHLINGKILDIGSKNRRYDALFDGEITAIDLNVNREKKLIFGDIEKGVDFKNNYFNSIICLEVFEYLDNYKKAIGEIYRVLQPRGRAIVTIPFMYHAHQDNIRFTEEFIKSKFDKFSSVECFKIGNGFIVIWDLLRKKIMKIKNKLLKYLLFLLILPYLAIIKIFKIENIKDDYYSGLFIILKK